MNLLTDILSLFNRKQIVDSADPEDLIVLAKHEEPDMLGIASPIPYKKVVLIKVSDLATQSQFCEVVNVNNATGDDAVGIYLNTETDPCRINLKSLVAVGNNVFITDNGNEIEISTDGEPNSADNVGGGAEVYQTKVGETLMFRTIVSTNGSVTIEQLSDTIDVRIDTSNLNALNSSCLSYNIIYTDVTNTIPDPGQIVFNTTDETIRIHNIDVDGYDRQVNLDIRFESKNFGLFWAEDDDPGVNNSAQYFNQCRYKVLSVDCQDVDPGDGINPDEGITGNNGGSGIPLTIIWSNTLQGLKNGGNSVVETVIYVHPTTAANTKLLYKRNVGFVTESLSSSVMAIATGYNNPGGVNVDPLLTFPFAIYLDSQLTTPAGSGFYILKTDYESPTTPKNAAQYSSVGTWENEFPGWDFVPTPASGSPTQICTVNGIVTTVTKNSILSDYYYEIPWFPSEQEGSFSPTIQTLATVCFDMAGSDYCSTGSGSGQNSNGETITVLDYDPNIHMLAYVDENLTITIHSLSVGSLEYDNLNDNYIYTRENGTVQIVPASAGLQGIQGIQGVSIQGIQGAIGLQGITLQGIQGIQGVDGYIGSDGLQGIQGIQGADGYVGSDGLQGVQGPEGQSTQGIQGIQGLEGNDGSQGTQGIQGISVQGVQGIQGLDGNQGIQGIQGFEGVGSQGTQGIQGLDGAFAAQGIQGVQGTSGIGTQGIQGIQGIQGLKGGNGVLYQEEITLLAANWVYNAPFYEYDYAHIEINEDRYVTIVPDNDFIGLVIAADILPETIITPGNVKLFATNLASADIDCILMISEVGVNGDMGLQGIQGSEGIQGSTGIGIQGIQGIQGNTGNNGIQGFYGIQGTQGTRGLQGIQGFEGTQGVQGVQGTTGQNGLQGIQGVQGSIGSNGIQGAQGVQGLIGAGLQGIQGLDGTQGIQGLTGSGLQGIQGPEGPYGAEQSITQLINLLHTDETASSEVASSTSESGAHKTYNLAANDYDYIKIEIITQTRVEQDANTRSNFTWRFKVAGSTVQTFVERIIASSTTSIDSGGRYIDTKSFIIAGGQVGSTALTITSQNSLSNGSTGAMVLAFRVYGVKDYTITAGPPGVQGIQGSSGSQGIQGTVGLQGIQGVQGILGVQGTTAPLYTEVSLSGSGKAEIRFEPYITSAFSITQTGAIKEIGTGLSVETTLVFPDRVRTIVSADIAVIAFSVIGLSSSTAVSVGALANAKILNFRSYYSQLNTTLCLIPGFNPECLFIQTEEDDNDNVSEYLDYYTGITSLIIEEWTSRVSPILDLTSHTALEVLSLTDTGFFEEIDLTECEALVYLKIESALIDALDLSQNTALTHLELLGNLSLPSLPDISANTDIVYLKLTNVIAISLDLSSHTDLVSIDLLVSSEEIDMSTCVNLEFVKIEVADSTINELLVPTSSPVAYVQMGLYSNTLANSDSDAVLAWCDAGGISNGYCYIDTMPIPSGAGLTSKANLESKGWTVNINGL